MSNENPFRKLNDEQLKVVHSTSEAFEKSLRTGGPVRIEQFLSAIAVELQPQVFAELLAIELEWRIEKKEAPTEGEYSERFPKLTDVVKRAIEEAELDISNAGSSASQQSGNSDSAARSRWKPDDFPSAGTVIDGRYTIIESIGEGGMGQVFLAEQHKPVTRQVAIKFIKAGLDSKAVLARFDLERKSLAMMDHPGIARVYDGGQTEAGLPYFAMELVSGVPVTRYCDEHQLDMRTRLNLFVAICKAVQHAHLKGIIHRDLKPGNILVTEVDGTAIPKVIDFGVAKAIDQQMTDQSLAASIAMIVGTPAYMSPEQANPESTDIDTRTDVYALGVVLYELLAGSPPHDTGSLPRAAIVEALRMIREVDSPRPSTKVDSSVSLVQIASNRSIEPEKLASALRGELDWIALKAIEKDRSRRYETVNGLARDVERYLSGDLVEARPPSNVYRLRKFVRRNKGQVIAGGLLLLSMTAGIVGTSWAMVEARKQEEIAVREVVAKKQALANEATERQYAEAVANFMVRDFLALTSLEGRLDFDDGGKSGLTKDSTLRDILDRAAEKLAERTDLEPQTKARLLSIVGQSYLNLGEFPKAIDAFQQSTAIVSGISGEVHIDTLREQGLLVYALYENGQNDLALPLAEGVLDSSIALLGPDHADVLNRKRMLARILRKSGDPARAVEILEETLAGLTSLHGPHQHEVLTNMYDLALALNSADKSERAVQLLNNTIVLQEEHLGTEHPDVHASRGTLATLYVASGDYDRAQPLLEEGVEWAKENYGAEDHNTIYAMVRLAGLYRSTQQMDKALPMFEQLLELTRKAFRAKHPNVANAASSLAMAYRENGDHEKVLPLFEEALALRTAIFGKKHPIVVSSMANVAAGLRALGETEKSQQISEESLELASEVMGDSHSTTIAIKQGLAASYWSAKKLDRSVPLFEEILKYWDERAGRSHPSTLMAIANVGINYRDCERLNEALPLLEEAWKSVPENPSLRFVGIELLSAYRQAGKTDEASALLKNLIADAHKKHPAESLKRSTALTTIGDILLRTGAYAEAEPLLREAMTIRQQHEPDKWGTFNSIAIVGEVLAKQNKLAEAEPLLIAAVEGMRAEAGKANSDRLAQVVAQLVELLINLDRTDEAAKWEAKLPSQ